MFKTTKDDLKSRLLKGQTRKTIDGEYLLEILFNIIEFQNFVKDNLPKAKIITKELPDTRDIRIFIPKIVNQEELSDLMVNIKRVYVDEKNKKAATQIASKLGEENKAQQINLTFIRLANEIPL